MISEITGEKMFETIKTTFYFTIKNVCSIQAWIKEK